MTTEHSGSGDLSRSMALLWDVQDRPSRGPKPALDVERIVRAAVEVADAEGLEAVSMRRVAKELGVGTMSLYRYLPGKAELLDLMLDQLSAVDPEHAGQLAGMGWRKALDHTARGMWQLYTTHPWLLHVDQARPVLGPNGLAGFEAVLDGIRGVRLSDQEKVTVVNMIDVLVSGIARIQVNAAQAEARTGVSDAEFWEAQHPALEAAMATGRYPRVFELSEDAFSASGEQIFEFALERLLDGIAALFDARADAETSAETSTDTSTE